MKVWVELFQRLLDRVVVQDLVRAASLLVETVRHVRLRVHRLEARAEVAKDPQEVWQQVLKIPLASANLLLGVSTLDLAAKHLHHGKIF